MNDESHLPFWKRPLWIWLFRIALIALYLLLLFVLYKSVWAWNIFD